MKNNDKLAALRSMLWSMEVEVGLEGLTQHQKDVYYAARLTADEDLLVQSDTIRHHPMIAQMARPTFYRALKDLLDKEFLSAASNRKDGKYRIIR